MHATRFALRSAIALALAISTASAADWSQFGYDAAHSGSNSAETTLGAANVAQLAPAYAGPVVMSSSVDSAPVYKRGVVTPSGSKNLLFFLSQNGKVMAIDAANGAEVWSQQTSGRQPTTASPALDPGGQFVYSYGTDGYAHKYRVGDGSEIRGGGWPQLISLKTNVEKGASGLTVASANGSNYLVVVTDGYIGDGGDYQGHLTSIDLASGTQRVFNAMCSNQTVHLASNACPGVQSGIWGRGGATFDADSDRVYIATGNGTFDANTGGFNWGDSVLALAPDGSGGGGGRPLDSYTPINYQSLDDSDTDLGSTSLGILPVPAGSAVAHLGLQVGKDAQLRLIDLDNMSGAGSPAHVGGELQLLAVPQGGNGLKEQPAVWSNPADHSTWLFVASRSGLSGLQLGLDANHKPQLSERWRQSGASTSPVLANGVLYQAGACSSGTCVNARNPLSGAVLWTSPSIGGLHWQSPIVVDGALYIADGNARLWKFAVPLGDSIFKNGFDGA